MTVCREETLSNGLHLVFTDQSNRYFGDYHRVCIEVTGVVAVGAAIPPNDPLAADAARVLGAEVHFRRTLEQMGVAGTDVEATRDRLIAAFLTTSGPYLSRPAFLRHLVENELRRRSSKMVFY